MLNNSNQSSIAFKKLGGKSHTDDNKAIGQEAETTFVTHTAEKIFGESINSIPTQAVIDGTAEEILFADFVEDISANGHAYFLNYPIGHPKVGQRISGSIPDSFGISYEIQITLSDTTTLAVLDNRNWVFDYASGIFFQQTPNASPTPLTANLFVYVGQTILDRLDAIVGGTVLDNFSAVVDPSTNDDNTLGYSVGSKWINTILDTAFILVDDSIGAAIWTLINDVTSFINGETPSGVKNGVNVNFIISQIPLTDSEDVFLNGLLQKKGGTLDYTLSGSTITFIDPPLVNDEISISYRI